MFFGHPVERLCTYQYSLVTLIPGTLLDLLAQKGTADFDAYTQAFSTISTIQGLHHWHCARQRFPDQTLSRPRIRRACWLTWDFLLTCLARYAHICCTTTTYISNPSLLQDAFFQPYLPLQQLDMLKDTAGWLCGSTNSIVTQQKEIDLLVNVCFFGFVFLRESDGLTAILGQIETGAIEFRNPAVERMVALTAADRKWMDEIVKDVNDGFGMDTNMSML